MPSFLSRRVVAACSSAIVLTLSRIVLAGMGEASTNERAEEPTSPPAIAQPEPSGADRPSKTQARHDAKRFVVARDFAIVMPVGALSDESAAMYGPLVRLGFHVNDSFEVGVRFGYLRGFDKEVDGVTGSLSSLPITATTRWFPLGDRSGPYAGAELGANVFRQVFSPRTSFWDVSADATWVRPSANVGFGWVWSRALPMDLRAQIASLDLFGKGGPTGSLMVGLTAGWSFFF
jgi:hypothetical protein